MKKSLLIALFATAFAAQAQAQSTPPAAAPATAPMPAPSAAKKELLQRLVVLQQPFLESMGRNLGEQPLRQLLGAAQQRVGDVPEDKRQAAITQIEGLARKYADDLVPLAKDAAAKVAGPTLTPVFDKNFTEEELRQLVTALESPAYKKYQGVMPEVSNASSEKLVAELRGAITPRLKTLEENMASALGLSPNGAAAPAPAKKASAPKPKK